MENNPCTSTDADQFTEQIEMKRWTKDLRSLPKFSHALLRQHLGVEGENDASLADTRNWDIACLKLMY
jgi:hypothetical protein